MNCEQNKNRVSMLCQVAATLAVALGTATISAHALAAGGDAPAKVAPTRLRRAASFLGIHFDFHAGTDCTAIGKNTTREMIEKILDQAHPDYIQIDCKGHPGLSSYPTKVGNQTPVSSAIHSVSGGR